MDRGKTGTLCSRDPTCTGLRATPKRWVVASHPSVIERLIGLLQETKIKGYVNIVGYRIISDENIDPGRYGFRLVHDTDRDHFFSSDEQVIIREWMKALMKATIDRDYTSASIIL